MGFNFIGVLMDELVTASATIHAAQIQANYALWAAVISAIIGSIGIIFAAWYAWQSGMKLQQHNNIIEAKREVYLDAIAKYQQLSNDLKLVTYVPDKFHEVYLSNKKDFLISINKVQLICDTANMCVVNDFKDIVDTKIIELYAFFELYLASYYSLIEFKEKFELAHKDLDNFLTENPKLDQGRVLHAGIHLSATKIQNKIEESRKEYEAAKIGYDFTLMQINEKLENFEEALNNKYKNFSNILRAELKNRKLKM